MTNSKQLNSHSGHGIQSIDDQLREMFQIHSALFDDMEARLASVPTTERRIRKSNLMRSAMRRQQECK